MKLTLRFRRLAVVLLLAARVLWRDLVLLLSLKVAHLVTLPKLDAAAAEDVLRG